ncbi:hypothetical protein OIV83_005067 [Microbotryomycetes sp. JL201]|nr:hypothetical protein OIV83_005067 [Microbotryomycetes sp. JL201]
MPALVSTPLKARINFVKHRSQFQVPVESFLTFDPSRLPPTEELDVPIYDLRKDIERGLPSETEQLDDKGFAVVLHETKCDLGEGLETVEGTNAYLEEITEQVRRMLTERLGASRILVWNSVVRRNNSEVVKEEKEARQLVPEEGKPPAKSVKAAARQAHVDQDEEYARIICQRAAGDDVFDKYGRVQIINLWRPLSGPVTNAPLAVCDFRSLDIDDSTMHFASVYGTGLGISHNVGQRWHYISHQMADEGLLLKCFDSWSADSCPSDRAFYAAHVACDVYGEEPISDPDWVEKARESIEVRLVVLHE